MNEEIDESEFFQQDFTTASEWEVFMAGMEQIIHSWRIDLPNNVEESTSSSTDWIIKSEKLAFADVNFTLFYYEKRDDECKNNSEEQEEESIKNPIDIDYNFELKDGSFVNNEHAIAQWYGLKKYIVLVPERDTAIVTESRIKILLSSAYIITGNLNINVPIFVQIKEKWQKSYLGVYEGEGVRTNFEMVHLKRGPPYCQYLNGLLDLFKTKIMSAAWLDTITVAVQITYNLNVGVLMQWQYSTINDTFLLPFGTTFEPVDALILRTTWQELSDNMIMDSESYSDLDPMQAQKWSLEASFSEELLCYLTDTISEFMQLFKDLTHCYAFLGDYVEQPFDDLSNALDSITEPKVKILPDFKKKKVGNSKSQPPLPEDVSIPILHFLFPDYFDEPPAIYKFKEPKENDENESYKGFKTCAVDSIVWRLSIVLSHALRNLGGKPQFAQIWFEFVQDVRSRWEMSTTIQGVAPGYPDSRTCLLHQKLQMLNCCIAKKKSREELEKNPTFSLSKTGDSSDEEEFYDCDEEEAKINPKYSLWNQPVGRQAKFENLKLLKTGDPLYIPFTQEPGPKTEDQLEEHTNVLLQLGTDAQGSELRAKMMSASLLSDMESFKAANPGSVLEDFIRWYSPRDWIEEEELDEYGQKKGHLSSRMQLPDNTWVQTWEMANPVPAHRQKRLFDDTREAEKVLHFLDTCSMSKVAELLLGTLLHASFHKLTEECNKLKKELPDTTETLKHLQKTIEVLTRCHEISPKRVETLIEEMSYLEMAVSQAFSIYQKLNPKGEEDEEISKMIQSLMQQKEVEINDQCNSKVGKQLIEMFSAAQKAAKLSSGEPNQDGTTPNDRTKDIFPNATKREFVMRVDAPRPSIYSAKCPQFLRAILSKEEFRLAGAFSEDIVFF